MVNDAHLDQALQELVVLGGELTQTLLRSRVEVFTARQARSQHGVTLAMKSMKKQTLMLVLLPLLCHCSARRVVQDATGTDLVAHDGASAAVDGALPPFCSGAAQRLTINGQPVILTGVTAKVGAGMQFYLCLDGVAPNTARIRMSDLGSHMARATSPCPSSSCTLHHKQDADFKGEASFNLAGSYPGASVDLCVTAEAKKTATGTLRSFQLSLRGMPLKYTCELGIDSSCNHSLMVSSTKGKCNADGSCSCLPGAQQVLTSGKCI